MGVKRRRRGRGRGRIIFRVDPRLLLPLCSRPFGRRDLRDAMRDHRQIREAHRQVARQRCFIHGWTAARKDEEGTCSILLRARSSGRTEEGERFPGNNSHARWMGGASEKSVDVLATGNRSSSSNLIDRGMSHTREQQQQLYNFPTDPR